MINVIDFDHGCGGLTAGFERYGEFITIDNVYLNNNNQKCYNETHLNPFWTELHVSEDDYDDLDIRLACFSPQIGGKLARRGSKNFDSFEIKKQLKWIKNYAPEVVVFSLTPDAIPHLHLPPKSNIERDKVVTSDNWPLFDRIVQFLHQNAYKNIIQFTLNYLDYNIPQDKRVSFYIAWDNNNSFNLYKPSFTTKKKVNDVLTSIDSNDIWHKPNFRFYNNCSKINPGSRASKSSTEVNKGYIRLVGDRVSPNLSNYFYRVSDEKPSIHPTEHRPLTIREGARLNGLDDTFTWDSNISKKDIGNMIYNSLSPRVSYYLAKSVFELLR